MARHMSNRWGVEVNHRGVSDWVKEAVKIRKDYTLSSHSSTAKIHRPPMNAKVHTVLHDWIEQALEDGMIINGDAIHSQWIKLCDMMEIRLVKRNVGQ